MPILKLTKTAVERLAFDGKQTEYFDTKLTGFGVRVNQNSKSYFAQGKILSAAGHRVKFNETIGKVGILPFEDAYAEAKRILEDAAKGVSPEQNLKQKRMQAELDEKRDMTLRDAFKSYIAVKTKLKDSTVKEYRVSLERNVPDWLDLPLRRLTSTMVVERHAQLGKRSRGQADSAMRVVRAMCQHVIDMYEDLDIISRNPVRKLSAAKLWYKLPRKTTYIRAEDLPSWFSAVLSLDELPRTFFLLLLFSGSRFEETAAIRVENFNFRAGLVVFRKTKSGKPLEVPISSYLLPRLEAYVYFNKLQPDDFLFPSIGRKKSKSGHIEDLRALAEKVTLQSGVEFSPHDLRRTFLTYAESLRIPKLLQKRLVGHAIPTDVTDGYIQIPFGDMQQALEDVTAYILKAAKQA